MQSVLRYLDPGLVSLAVLLGLVSLVLLEIFKLISSKSRSPPGPTPLPFVGNLLQFMKDPLKATRSMVQYGEMCCVYVGRRPMIVLNTIETVKEALVQKGTVYSGRPPMPLIEWVTKGYGIIAVTYGHAWKQQRRFALHTLRNFGLGKKTIEERVAEEANCLITEMLKHEGKALNPMHPIMNAVSNIICSIVFGDRFDYNNKRFAKLLEILNENIRLSGSPVGMIFNLIPFIKHFPGPHQKVRQNADALVEFIRELMEEHREKLDEENLHDFIDAYLVEIRKQEPIEDSTFHEENLLMSTADLFLAGTETTATTLRWGLIFMMNHPEIQERCHQEIVRVLGYDRAPSMDDRTRMPYIHATVHEIQRFGNIVPLGVVHQTTETSQLRGYTVPKGTEIAPNLMAIMQDKEHWKHPDSFNPDNFLDENGQFCKNEFFLAFSLGPRVCLGESLARTELFIFFTSLLQRLRFSWPHDAPPINMDGNMGVVRMPPTFHMICRSRECSVPLTP
ncbi:cytochrome P450 2B4-like [Tachysurus fulvidraco]|uniref:cytochrome P450 2B4-like n=1 Tax=Tachysurus fulvidraco TaxID=1234273 RepID=UPI000F4F7F24|nr:cytochrome P450 2B4-like [Tachysurus fulvidraco]